MYAYSFPIFFRHANVLLPIEFAILLLILTGGLWFFTPSPQSEEGLQRIENSFLKAAWCGMKPLWLIFWPFYLFLHGILFYLDGVVKSGQFTVSSWDMAHFMLFTPIAIWAICVWRCSVNCSDKIWGVLARLGVASVFLEYLIKLYLRIDLPRIYFQCEEAMLNYSSCF